MNTGFTIPSNMTAKQVVKNNLITFAISFTASFVLSRIIRKVVR